MNPKVKAKWTSNDVAWGTKSLYHLYEENQEEKKFKDSKFGQLQYLSQKVQKKEMKKNPLKMKKKENNPLKSKQQEEEPIKV